jgi:2-methylcitrate synthase/citrate synthase II
MATSDDTHDDSTPDIRKGLEGVVVDRTAVSQVNSETNSLLYRGYPVHELAADRSFEEVAHLLLLGELPDAEQLAAFTRSERGGRELDATTKTLIDSLPTDAHPMDVLRTVVSEIGATDPTSADPEALIDQAVALFARLPAVIAYDQRRRHGLPLLPPRDDLGYSANFLSMVFGKEPDESVRQAFDTSMILYAEHGFNASTFTARVITSTLSDYYSAVVGAIGALKGPLHGGANEAVMHAFDEIGSADGVPRWLDDALGGHRKVMGFGHRVYKHGDSRVPTMEDALETLAGHYERSDLLTLYRALKDEMASRTGIKPNVDYPSGPAYHLMGFDTEQFTPLFVASRVIGWTAHIREQREANALIRPLSAYVGPDERHIP